MSKSYFEASRDALIKRLEYINKRDYVEFFRDSDEFVIAIAIAYFSLAEELLIERDSKDNNIATRLKKHVNDIDLNNLLTDDIIIHDKEPDGNSVEWFLAALRNGIIHNGFEVDYENRIVNVFNNGNLNKLRCSISFDWFKMFAMDDILLKRELDTYKHTVVFTPFIKPEYATYINNFDDIRNFITNDLPAYDIEIFFDESYGDKTKIRRDDFLQFCREREQLFWALMNAPEDLNQDEIDRLEQAKVTVTNELACENDSLNSEEYNKKYYSRLFSVWFSSEFKSKYPNYNIIISNFNRESPKLNLVVNGLKDDGLEKQLFPTYRKKQEFFNERHPVFQRMDVASAMSRVVNFDQVDYLLSLQYLLNMYLMHKDIVKDDYGLSDFIREILKSRTVPNSYEIQQRYLKSIHDGMVLEGIVHSYDRQITERLIYMRDSHNEDIYVRCRELCGSRENLGLEEIDEIGKTLKSEFESYYDEITRRLVEYNVPSDQVLEVYNEGDLYRLCNAKGVINEQLNEIVISLLYTLGINTFVVNKETAFNSLTEPDYNFMDGLKIEGYSKDSFTKLDEIKDKRNSHLSHLKGINKKIKELQTALSRKMDKDEIDKLTALKDDFDKDAAKELAAKEKCQLVIDNTKIVKFGGIDMASLSNIDCATTIRNCFAHCGRIFVEGRESGGETNLVLTDYDENGNLSGVVRTNLSSMIKFFSNQVFKNAIDKKGSSVVSVTSEKSK